MMLTTRLIIEIWIESVMIVVNWVCFQTDRMTGTQVRVNWRFPAPMSSYYPSTPSYAGWQHSLQFVIQSDLPNAG
jgi:hypothetical protein